MTSSVNYQGFFATSSLLFLNLSMDRISAIVCLEKLGTDDIFTPFLKVALGISLAQFL